MHTDEYTISLYREIIVCKNMIRYSEKRLARFEKNYKMTTDSLVRENKWYAIQEEGERIKWQDAYAGLLSWQKLLDEYETAFRMMK